MQDEIQRERNSHRVQLQLREVNFFYAEGCRAALQSHWCSPFLCIGGRAEQDHNSSKFTAAYLQELLQAEDRRTNSEAYQTPSSTQPDQWAKAPSPFAHYQPAMGSAWKWTKFSSQHLQMAQTPAPITCLAQVTQGQRPCAVWKWLCCFWRQPYTQNQVPLQPVIPSQKSCPELDATLAWPQQWGCGGTWYHAACSTTLVKTKVSAWASVSNMTVEPVAAGAGSWGLQDHSDHHSIHAAISS